MKDDLTTKQYWKTIIIICLVLLLLTGIGKILLNIDEGKRIETCNKVNPGDYTDKETTRIYEFKKGSLQCCVKEVCLITELGEE